MTNQLETEYKTYLDHSNEFVSKHLNEFVLIKGDKVINFYQSYKEALEAGLARFGNVPFFVKAVAKEEEIHVFYNGLP